MRHEHEWTETDSAIPSERWMCAECQATSDTCGTCGRASGSSLLICPGCEWWVRQQLDRIGVTLAHWDERDRHRARSPMAFDQVRVHQGRGKRDRHDPPGPEDVEARLLGWVARWYEHMPAPGLGPADYLKQHILWGAHNPGVSRWEEFTRDLPRIHSLARVVVGTAPDRLQDRCMYCDGVVVRDRADRDGEPLDDGLSDTHRCTDCGLTWPDRDAFRRVARHRIHDLPREHPDRAVTVAQAAEVLGVPVRTIRTWIRRDRDQHQRSVDRCDRWDDRWTEWEEAGNIGPIPEPPDILERELPEVDTAPPRYLLADLAAFADRRVSEGRPGRPARVA